MALALDEAKETDNIYEKNGFTFLVDKEFMEKVQPIKIDFTMFGFKITSAMEFGGGCGDSCSTKGSCCA